MVLHRDTRGQAESTLVATAQDGDSSAFEELVRRYKDRIYRVSLRLCAGNTEDALDLAQEVFIRAYRGLESFRGDAQFGTWLYRITVNLARNRVRDLGRKGRSLGVSLEKLVEDSPELASTAVSDHMTPTHNASASELEAQLQECLDTLPEPCRSAFILLVFEDLTYEEIAESLGCPAGTVKSRLNQARRLLRDQLKERSLL